MTHKQIFNFFVVIFAENNTSVKFSFGKIWKINYLYIYLPHEKARCYYIVCFWLHYVFYIYDNASLYCSLCVVFYVALTLNTIFIIMNLILLINKYYGKRIFKKT